MHTRHAQHETLYWTKAASILGREQCRIPGSEVPIPPRKALHDTRSLLTANLPHFVPPADSRELIFGGWRELCRQFGPIFVEKSPHHLHQWAALDLLMEAVRLLPETDFRFVGLVRNPMDVLYSMWRRWRIDPIRFQHHWRHAYENLLRFKQHTTGRLLVIRYEDLAAHRGTARDLLEFVDQPAVTDAENFVHRQSLQRWREDPWFGFQLDPEVERLARSFGYGPNDLVNRSFPLWDLHRMTSQVGARALLSRWRVLRRRLSHHRQLASGTGR
jgi:Sulfotransferase family